MDKMSKGYSIYHKDIQRDKDGGFWVHRESLGVYFFRKYIVEKFIWPVIKFFLYIITFGFIWIWKITLFPFITLWKLVFKRNKK